MTQQITETLSEYLLQDVSGLEGDITTRHFVRVDQLPDLFAKGNPKLHDLGEIWESIAERGFIDDGKLDVNLTNRAGGKGALVYGNGRNEALYHGWTQWVQGEEERIPKGIKYDSDYWYIPVVTGLDAKSEAAALSLLISHNTLTLMGGDIDQGDIWAMFDKDVLAEIGKQVNAALEHEDDLQMPAGFDSEDLNDLVHMLNGTNVEFVDDAPPPIDKAEELNERWQVSLGDVWVIPSAMGDFSHRLMCGSSTDAEDVARLLDGNTPRNMVTDPPYGVEYDQDWRSQNRTGKVQNDDNASWFDAWELSPASVAYVWHASRHADVVRADLERAGFEHRAQIIWNKPVLVFSQGHYHWKHEPCFYCVRKGQTAAWIGDRKQTTVWDIGQDEDAPGGHGTQKPVEAMGRPLMNHEGDVHDPFGGSGTTIVAAEQLGRRAFVMEIEPKYVASILERMTLLGLEPVREE